MLSKWRLTPSWIYPRRRFLAYTRFWTVAVMFLQNFINLRYLNLRLSYWGLSKIQNGGCPPSRIIIWLRWTICEVSLAFKFRVDRVYRCEDISGRIFRKFGLQRLSGPKIYVLRVLARKSRFIIETPKGTSLPESTPFGPSCVVIGPAVWSGRGAKNTSKQRVEPNLVTNWLIAPTTPYSDCNHIWYVGWSPKENVSDNCVSERSVKKCRSCRWLIAYTAACCYRTM